MFLRAVSVLLLAAMSFATLQAQPSPRRKLLVVSVDGLDWRYFQRADEWGLKIPTMRKLMREGEYASGVVGVYPSITWPSHTSLITGVRPVDHGILGNRRPKEEGGDYYWTPDLLHAKTLWQAASEQGRTTAAVTWPVTTDAKITYDLPEYFKRRNGGYMDLDGIASRATPGLVDEIRKAQPMFATEWTDDRARTLAAIFMMQQKHADLVLVHLVDLDSDEHDMGPFDMNAFARLEVTDHYLGEMIQSLPPDYDLAVVSDHGFERIDGDLQLPVLLAKNNVKGDVRAFGGLAATRDVAIAELLRTAAKNPANHIGREIPHDELVRFAPQLGDSAAAFEPETHYMFAYAGKADGPYITPPPEKGDHGLWPTHPGYRSVFLTYGPGIHHKVEPEIMMTDIASRLATILGISFTPTPVSRP